MYVSEKPKYDGDDLHHTALRGLLPLLVPSLSSVQYVACSRRLDSVKRKIGGAQIKGIISRVLIEEIGAKESEAYRHLLSTVSPRFPHSLASRFFSFSPIPPSKRLEQVIQCADFATFKLCRMPQF